MTNRRSILQKTSSIGLASVSGIAGIGTAIAEEDDEGKTENKTGIKGEINDEQDAINCDGSPQMSQTSVTSPQDRITSDDPAVVEANFRPDPTISDDCTVFVDLEFSFTDAGYQWGGGAQWDQATTDLLVGTFEVQPGEIRDIRGELHTNGAEPGDTVTVVADYELWFEGYQENSVQQSGIRHTIEVEEKNPAEENGESGEYASIPGFGVSAAIAGVMGAGYLLKQRIRDDTE